MAGSGGIPAAGDTAAAAPSAAVAVPAPENAPAMVPVSNPKPFPTPSAAPAIADTAISDTITGCQPVRSADKNAGPAAMPTMWQNTHSDGDVTREAAPHQFDGRERQRREQCPSRAERDGAEPDSTEEAADADTEEQGEQRAVREPVHCHILPLNRSPARRSSRGRSESRKPTVTTHSRGLISRARPRPTATPPRR